MPSLSALNSSASESNNIQRRGPETSFDRLTSFGDIQFSNDFRSKWLRSVKKFLDGHGLFHLWNEIFVFLCVVAASLDPLFCYILVIDDKNKCLVWDGTLKIIVVVLRSFTDLIYVVLLIFQFYYCWPVAPRSEYDPSVWAGVKRYLSSSFLIDVLSVLPLPQVVFLLVIPNLWSSSLWTAMRALKFVLLFQFVPRVLRIYAFLKRVTWTCGIFPENTGAKAAFNLFLYMLASHAYLQRKTARLEEMRLKGQDIELWMAFHSLPRDLKNKIKKYERFKWRNTKGIDLERLLVSLPRDLRTATKRHLCEIPIMKIPTLKNMDQHLLDAIYDYLKPALYIERNFIVREGEPLDEMIFITQGQLWTYHAGAGNAMVEYLKKGDFYGAELLDWALTMPFSAGVPMSTKTVRAHTKAEAFVLKAKDLKTVVSKFWWLFSREMRDVPAFREKWFPSAALVLQAAWRRYSRNKVEKIDRMALQVSCPGPSNLRAAAHGSKFLTLVLRGMGKIRAKKVCKGPPETTRV